MANFFDTVISVLKQDCISANDDKEAAARQIALNSLEDATNPSVIST